MPEKPKGPDLSGLLHAGSAARRESTRGDKPSGKFAEIGGVEIRPPQFFETPEKPIDFCEIGGKRIGKHIASRTKDAETKG